MLSNTGEATPVLPVNVNEDDADEVIRMVSPAPDVDVPPAPRTFITLFTGTAVPESVIKLVGMSPGILEL